jgi:signal transduction histidine kinase
MSDVPPGFSGPIAALIYLVPTVVWAIIAEDAWRFRLRYRPRSSFYRILPYCTTCMALFYALGIPTSLALSIGIGERPPRWFDLNDVAMVAALSSFRHLAWFFRLEVEAPSRSWLVVNYSLAVLVGTVNLFPELIPVGSLQTRFAIARGLVFPFVMTMLVLSIRHVSRFAQPGAWRPGGNEARSSDLAVVSLAFALVIVLFVYYSQRTPEGRGIPFIAPPPLLVSGIGLLFAVPFAVRIVVDVFKRFLVACAVLGIAAAGFLTFRLALWPRLDPTLREPASFAWLCVLIFVLLYVSASIRAAVDEALFRRSARRRTELLAVLHSLSPELGVLECARRTISDFVRIMRVRGAALLLTRGRGAVTSGRISLEPLERIWAEGDLITHLPRGPASLGSFRELPVAVQQALAETEIVGLVPVTSPRQRWGAAFLSGGPLGSTIGDDDRQAIQHLSDQLALLLDSAELLEQTVAAERSLAHGEKLAAIGELAARVAHEIRNPVTAARSLAQLLVRDPTSELNEEHASLILTELERVERQIADLLRFARRDDLRVERVDLGELARLTTDELDTRLRDAEIELRLDLTPGLVAQADREKIRQVLINLIENSIDALADSEAPRTLRLSVGRSGPRGIVRVADNGPGVPADVLPRLFEPFFSLKSHGTGLGLAIAKRTLEAHGGTIAVSQNGGTGLCFTIEVPLAEGEEATP